jgi:hypothetical protein
MPRALERVFASRLPTRRSDQAIASDLFKNLALKRKDIQAYALERYSWSRIGEKTSKVYSRLLDHGQRSAA